ncbi:GNAT family N-acetyltransferase [Mucilaginibacter terrae]|uniref:GNAT family N-acetyltransferase n=1 Tax=Mucilaginibacter terrae TaxID=1955052 RepID=UPI00364007E9
MEDLHIEQIRPELTWRLRRDVLYPHEPLYVIATEEDNYGIHFGCFYKDRLIGVVSLFQHVNEFQFRKFAVAQQMQYKGVGNTLLQYIINFATLQGGKRIWCNARLSAIGFYYKAGFSSAGQTFSKNNFDYEILEKLLP